VVQRIGRPDLAQSLCGERPFSYWGVQVRFLPGLPSYTSILANRPTVHGLCPISLLAGPLQPICRIIGLAGPIASSITLANSTLVCTFPK
jgi:hypothetical protein